jgi:hypothetical protein
MKKIKYIVFIASLFGTIVAVTNLECNKSNTIIDARKANIKGLNKVTLLKRLFKAAKQKPYEELLNITQTLSRKKAEEVITRKIYIEDLNGKFLNIDLSGDTVDTWGYNKVNGEGKHLAEKIINQMREEQKIKQQKKKIRDSFGSNNKY